MRYLTKSRFKLATQCPTKLFYTGKKDYPDKNQENDFLQQLAEGGYQVGKLAEYKFPGGIVIDELDYDAALANTNELLNNENCIIYEAAFRYQNLFIRADVVKKVGKIIYLYEVKAKSYSEEDGEFMGARGELSANWKEYLYDVAFQKYVIQKVFPDFVVKAHLTLINKDHACTMDGLHQNFRIKREIITLKNQQGEEKTRTKRYIIVPDGIAAADLDTDILINKDVDAIAKEIIDNKYKIDFNHPELNGKSFKDAVKLLSDKYYFDVKFTPLVASRCGKCEFKASEEEIGLGKKHGQFECLKFAWQVNDNDLKKATVFELWKGNMGGGAGAKTNTWLLQEKYFLEKLEREDFASKNDVKEEGFMGNTDRREVQVNHVKEKNNSSTIFKNGIKEEMETLVYPLHFIDFETIGTAIPFNKGRRPYEAIAFQFSHHTMDEKGNVIHANEWINIDEGAFPNFEFVRALKKALGEKGSIFRYSNHENTILNKIEEQLNASQEKDRVELIEFIHSITLKKENNKIIRKGERCMIDLLDWVRKYYYHPLMKGSNSIKVVLPAILNDSDFLEEKYSQAIYNGKNFKNKVWYELDENGLAKDPYKLLPAIDLIGNGENENDEDDSFEGGEKLNSGGPAMMAYAEMQFMETDATRKENLKKALLRYCELDTLAMVLIFEHWKSLIDNENEIKIN
jgi:hypothetical protein